MKSRSFFVIVTTVVLTVFPGLSFSQAPYLGIAGNFSIFTVTGAVGNTAVSHLVGSIGTGTGAITGFEPPTTLQGQVHNNNSITNSCSTALVTAYAQLYNTPATSTAHTPAFGGGETLVPGVYSIAAAGSVAGNLILDAQGNPEAVFIFKFGGAFTTGAGTTISLTNGALSCNVFWGAEGAIAMAAGTVMKGTLIANNGAISMGDGGNLEGRMLSTTGAASVYGVTIILPPCTILIPNQLTSFTAYCDNNNNAVLRWSTSTESNNDYFTIERSAEAHNWQVVGTVDGAGNSSGPLNYSLVDPVVRTATSYYRIKQTDLNGEYKYLDMAYIKNCVKEGADLLTIYPNPAAGQFNLLFKGDPGKVHSIAIFDLLGKQVGGSHGFQSGFDLSGKSPGVYFVKVQLGASAIFEKIIIAK